MNYLSQVMECFANTLEQLGLYEPEIDIDQARSRLSKEGEIWKKCQGDRVEFWDDFQTNNKTIGALSTLVERAIVRMNKGVAVDLGCGINSTAFNLLERGWKVYAVDSSESVIHTLVDKVSRMRKKWIENGQLVLVHQSIEEFEYPENVHLITATESLA